MNVSAHTYTAKVGTTVLSIKDGSVKMDEGWAPHVQGSLTITAWDEDLYALLDPREDVRVEVTATSSDGTSRTFNLGLRERTIDHTSGDVSLDLASDEALLQDYARVAATPDTSALSYQSSLRSIINNVVLSKIGATLEAGTADTPFNVVSDSENLILNPSLEVNANNWTVGGNSSIARNTAQHYVGAACLAMANIAVGLFAVAVSPSASVASISVQSNAVYTFSVYARANANVGAYIGLRFFDGAGVQLTTPTSSTTTLTTAGWQRITLTTTSPATAAKVLPIVWGNGTTNGHVIYLDAAMLNAGALETYFDGSTTDTLEYAYLWDGTAHDSESTRTALISRSPDTLVWEPGVSAWDFIQPIFQTMAMRLFCDEQRKWHLVDTSYYAPGYTLLTEGVNITQAQDTISRDSSGEWYDAVLVRYKWRDSTTAEEMEAYDFETTPGYTKTLIIEIERPYPGPGFAAYALSRSGGKGRVLDISAISNYAVSPTQAVTTTLPFSPIQTGIVSAVSWDFGTDEMSVETRGLTDTPATAWVFLDPGDSWTDSPPGASWVSETI